MFAASTTLRAAICGAFIAQSGCAGVPDPGRPMYAATEQEAGAARLVDARIAAYNRHDIEAFLATYAQDVRIYVYPERLLGQGRERMRRIFGPQFARGQGTVSLRSQHVLENKVVNVEDVTIDGVSERNIAIYTIANDLIAEVRLIEPGE